MDNLGSSRFEDLFCGTVYTSEGYQDQVRDIKCTLQGIDLEN